MNEEGGSGVAWLLCYVHFIHSDPHKEMKGHERYGKRKFPLHTMSGHFPADSCQTGVNLGKPPLFFIKIIAIIIIIN